MRSYCAVHVDVGYLLASAATYVTGSSLRRGVVVDYPTLIARLVEQAETDSGLPLLRVNWYDSGARPGGMPDYQQEEIGLLPRVKLRLGRLSYSGDQKGVDIRIGLDLAIQGRNRVADAVYLVSGDDDLTEAVEEAQSHGVQVVLLAVADRAGRPHGVSKHLRREVDGLLLVDAETIGATVRSVAIPEELLPDGAKGDAPAAEVAPAQEPPVAIEEATAQSEGVSGASAIGTGVPVSSCPGATHTSRSRSTPRRA
ncbi:NYN domain-containing protein [Janibacter melonis]|uniref:NYN domain-containing protein n=1 Tax=Janibacter melonis TaxID=262209 RepID=UPI0020962FCE|nr:NYN domain-containing protein [Janibacter melonis]